MFGITLSFFRLSMLSVKTTQDGILERVGWTGVQTIESGIRIDGYGARRLGKYHRKAE